MELHYLSYQGTPINKEPSPYYIPTDLMSVLEQINGFIQFDGGLHIRGICSEPDWHSLEKVWFGDMALFKFYPSLTEADIPFGQDVLGDQFILRDGIVHRLYGETGELESLGCSVLEFLEAAQANPVDYLSLQPLIQFYQDEGNLQPGQLLNAYPPFCTKESANGVSLKAVPAPDRIRFLADFSAQIARIADGQKVAIKVVNLPSTENLK